MIGIMITDKTTMEKQYTVVKSVISFDHLCHLSEREFRHKEMNVYACINVTFIYCNIDI